MNEIRVLTVEDEPIIARDIAATLEGIDYSVSGIALSGRKALAELENNLPDIALLDINLGGEPDGIRLGDTIRRQYEIPFIYLTSHADRATVERAKYTLPMGYIVKPFDEKDLFTTLEIALFNYSQFRFPVRFDLEKLNARLLSKLTPKEFEILQDLYEGKTNQQLAARHYISLNTVKTHVKHLYEKLDVQSRPGAIVLARKWLA